MHTALPATAEPASADAYPGAAPARAVTTPDDALAALAAHDGAAIVDFDETLYLRNSTEDFLDAAAPGALAKLVLTALDVVKPWRLAGGEPARDLWRVALVTLLMPWTWLIWRARAPNLARAHVNTPLAEALRGRAEVVVASIGFRAIIAPLLAATDLRGAPLIACSLIRPADRLRGKRALIEAALAADVLPRAVVVTDSLDDAPVLDAAQRGLLVLWPQARFREAQADVYLPFAYLSRVKRPGERYLWRGVIQDDLAFWLLATLPLAAAPGWHVLGLALLLVSFWAIYETGYVDNDRMGARHEADPHLSEAFHTRRVPTPAATPWIWAAVFGAAGLFALSEGAIPEIGAVLAWGATLCATTLAFRVFNRIDKRSRTLLYPVLQAFRVGAVVAVVPIAPLAVAGLGGAIVSAWTGYVVYRYRAQNVWPDLPLGTIRLVATALLAALLLAALGPSVENLAVAGLFVAWNAIRARREIADLARTARRIDREARSAEGG